MSLTQLALRNDRVTWVLVSVLVLAGVGSYLSMPQQMDPGFLVRSAQIITYFPGASPERVESLVTDPIEQSLQALPELDFVASTSRTGVSIVKVNVREEFKSIRPIWDSMRRKVEAVRSQLPDGIQGPNINDELGDIYPMLFSLSVDGFSEREVADIAETLRDELLYIEGVGKVEILGDQDERIFLDYRNARLSQLGLSPGAIQQQLAARNIIMPGGQIELGPERIALEPSGNFDSLEELSRTLVNLPKGGVTTLGDVATVTRGTVDPPKGLVTVDGSPGVTLAVNMAEGHNLVALGQRVRAYFAELPARFPHGIDFIESYFQPVEVEQKVEGFRSNVFQAIAIVLGVMLLFLGLRTGWVVSALIPTTIIITLWLLGLVGETLNQMSLAALIIALGLLVDNAIVVSESILVRLGRGEQVRQAAIDACNELRGPLLISSLTTAAAFLPIYLAESAVGEYTGALFVVVTITLLVSWLLALTFVPIMAVQFLRAPKKQSDEEGAVSRFYRRALATVLRFRALSLTVVIVAFAASLQLWGLVPNIFFPAQERAFFLAELSLPSGTSIRTTQALSKRVDAYLEGERKAGRVTRWTSFIGKTPVPFTLGYSPEPSLGGYLELMVHTHSHEGTAAIMADMTRWVFDTAPDVKPYIRQLTSGPASGKPVQIRLSGPDSDKTFAIAEEVRAKLSSLEGTANVGDNWGSRVKKLFVHVSPERARNAGISNMDVAQALQTYLSGLDATRYREGDDRIPVTIRSTGSQRNDIERVRNLSIFPSRGGASVPLSQVAEIELAWQPASVLRRDRYRTVAVEADVLPGSTPIGIIQAITPWLEASAKKWGPGVRYAFGGDMESSVKANESIAAKLPVAGLIILLLLVLQFNALRKPVIVLSTIALALIGVVIGLVVMRSSFGFMTLLGVISLAGIVINNAIVLLDRIRIETDEVGRDPYDAILEASVQRVRPILLTTATTVASLIPLYLSGGAMWQPMAVAIIFGLVFATFLTLGVVPLLYALLYRIKVPPAEPPAQLPATA